MEQVSAPTAVGCGSTDREPSGKSIEQPKLPSLWAGVANRQAVATFCCGGLGLIIRCWVVTPDMTGIRAGCGAVHPSRSFRFLLMQVSCGLSIGMTDGGASPPASKAACSMRWQSCRVLSQRGAPSFQTRSPTCGHPVDTGPTELPARTWALVPCPRTESPQPVSSARRRWSTDRMQLREVGKLAAYLWKMRWLQRPSHGVPSRAVAAWMGRGGCPLRCVWFRPRIPVGGKAALNLTQRRSKPHQSWQVAPMCC